MTRHRQIPLPLATSTWDQTEREALLSVIESDQFTMGARVQEFEQAFANYFGAPFAVMVNSGSSANLAAVAAAVLNPEIPLRPGDEVLVPAVSWSTTYYPLHQYGLKLRFVDIDVTTLNMNLELVEEAITDKTRGIFAVNLLGNPLDFARLAELAKKYDLVILEDNCESLGAQFEGKFAGTFGVMGTFSSFFSHHISTMEGGLVLAHDERTLHTLQSIRAHGWLRGLPQSSPLRSGSSDPFTELFRFVLPGYNLRPLEMSGALGMAQLAKIPALIAGRRANAEVFVDLFDGFPGADIQTEVGQSSWFGFAMTLKGALAGKRPQVVAALQQAGVDCRPIVAGNFTNNPVMDMLDASISGTLVAADRIDVDGFFVGNHHYGISSELHALRDYLGELYDQFA